MPQVKESKPPSGDGGYTISQVTQATHGGYIKPQVMQATHGGYTMPQVMQATHRDYIMPQVMGVNPPSEGGHRSP